MAQGEKSAFYRALKDAEYPFDKHYRDYTTEELRAIAQQKDLTVEAPPPKDAPPVRDDEVAALREQLSAVTQVVTDLAALVTADQRRAEHRPLSQPGPEPKPAPLDPKEHAGVTLNTHADDEVLEVDEFGNAWYQREVTKPGFPKPRGRRILRYDDPGVVTEKIRVGEYVETFEVAGDPKTARPAEVKITLPSHQTGIYKPKDMPFKVHTYNGARGFDMIDVQKYYGGADLVPDTIKRVYVSTDLCYEIQSVIRTIENEYRERVLRTGKGL